VDKDQRPRHPKTPMLWPFKGVHYGWAIMGALFIVSFIQAPMFGPVAAIFIQPIEDEMGWSRTEITLAFTLGSIAGALASLIVGRLLDRFGSRVIIVVASIIMAVSMVGLYTVQQPWQFWLYFGAARAAAMAGIQLGVMVTTANWFIRTRGRATAVGGGGLRAGQAVMPLLILAIITAYSWREAYLVAAALSIVFILVPAALFLRRRPEDMGLLPDGGWPEQSTENASQSPTPTTPTVVERSFSLREAIHTRALWLVTLSIMAGHFGQTAVNFHMAISLHDRGMSYGLTVSIVAIFAVSSALSVLPAGLLMERVHVRYGIIAVSLMFVASMLLLMSAETYAIAVAFGVLFGVASGLWTITQRLVFANYFGRRNVGSIRGFAEPFMGVLSPFGPLLAGILRDNTGDYNLVFTIFIGMFVVMLAAMVLAIPPKLTKALSLV